MLCGPNELCTVDAIQPVRIYARIASIHLDQFCPDLQRCIGRTVGTCSPGCSSWTLGAFLPLRAARPLNALGPLRADRAAKADGVTDPSTITVDDYAYTLNSNAVVGMLPRTLSAISATMAAGIL